MNFSKIYIFLVSIFFLMIVSAQSQSNGNIRGFVFTKDNGEPALFTNVFLKGTKLGANTDLNGFFSITKIPPGTYTLMATYVGYDTSSEVITVKSNDLINKKYYLNKGAVQLQEVV